MIPTGGLPIRCMSSHKSCPKLNDAFVGLRSRHVFFIYCRFQYPARACFTYVLRAHILQGAAAMELAA